MDQFEALRKANAELEVKYDTLNRELTIAKSDCMQLLLDTLIFLIFLSNGFVTSERQLTSGRALWNLKSA